MKYWKTKNDSTKKPKGFTSIKGIVCGPVKGDKKFEYSFMILAPQRTWYLKAASAEDLKKWKRTLLLQGAKWQARAGREYTISANGIPEKKSKKK